MCYRKRVSPALYIKQPTEPYRDRCWGGSSTDTPKRNDRERAKETNADNDGSTKTKKPRDRCAHRNLPLGTKTPKRRHLSTPPRRIATMTTLLPRVFPGTRRGERKGSPRRPPGRSGGTHRRHRAGVGHADRGFPRSQPAPRALRSLPSNQPPSCANMVMRPHAVSPRHREVRTARRRIRAGTRASAPSARGRAPPPLSATVAVRTQ